MQARSCVFAHYEGRLQIVGWEPPTNGVQLFTPSLSPTSSLLTFCFLCRPPLRLAPHHAGLRQPLRWLSAVLDFDTIRHLPADATHAAAAAVTARSTLTLTLHLGERDGVQVRARITAPPALECAGEGFGATHAQCSSDNGEMYRLYCRRAWCVVLKSHECWWDAAIPWTALSGASYGWPSFARANVNHSMSNTISTAGIGCTCVTASVTVAWRRLGYYMLAKIRPRSTIRISGCDPEAP